MRKVYYIYNPRTQTYDRIYPTVRQRALSILRRLFIGMGLGAGSFIVLLLIFGSPSEKELRMENSRLLAQYNVLSRRLDDWEYCRMYSSVMIICIVLFYKLIRCLRLSVKRDMVALIVMKS